MPIRLSELVAQERWVAIDVSGVEVNVAYRPNAITLRRSNELERLETEFENNPDIDIGVETARMFCDLVGNWDITDEHDRPYPITVESLQEFPANIIMAIMTGIRDELDADEPAKKTSGGTSDAGLQPTGSLAPARNGIH